ncbi:MAG: FliI/YscN family ATPase [Nitrospirae bacterium]|nr:FliI/YscN family ATPase [Nitrospirota bacterium]
MAVLTLSERLGQAPLKADVRAYGRLTRAFGLLMEGTGMACSLGDMVEVLDHAGRPRVRAEVVGFRDGRALMMPLGDSLGIGPGDWLKPVGQSPGVLAGEFLLGRVLDAMGDAIDGRPLGADPAARRMPLHGVTLNPMARRRIQAPMPTGVRAIDGLLSLGEGQRVGIFAGGGVGKSKLMGMIAGQSAADVNVIALIGERGREVREFVERELGSGGMARSVVVAVTADKAPLLRQRGAYVATAIAEYFRDRGLKVMLMMDSVTRFAMARREVGLSVGEPAATKGYTPSVFAAIPALVERAGMGAQGQGSITGIYTVLVEGDDLGDPVADTLRASLDGHFVLSRGLAAAGHFPALDVGASVSRVMVDVVAPEHVSAAQRLCAMLAVYEEARDLLTIGAYKPGNRPDLDQAVKLRKEVEAFLTQGVHDRAGWGETVNHLQQLARKAAA